jgi:hypothetical protein
METNNIKSIEDKFKEFREKEEEVFDISKLEDKGRFKDTFFYNGYFDFISSLDKEIDSLPQSKTTLDLLERWIDNLNYWIKSRNGSKLSDISKIHYKHRKELKSKLIAITKPMKEKVIAANEAKEKVEETKEKLSIKQQILLLKALGVLDNPEISKLPNTKQSKLYSHLLNRSDKNVKDYLTYIDKKNPPPDFFIYKDDNVKKINELLRSVDLQGYSIKL